MLCLSRPAKFRMYCRAIDLNLDDDSLPQVMAVHQRCEATEANQPTGNRPVRVGVSGMRYHSKRMGCDA